MRIRAGELNRLFTILEQATQKQTNGEEIPVWAAAVTPVTFWGRRTAIRGSEIFDGEAQTDRTEQRFEIKTRYRTDINALKRLSDSEATYEIETFSDPDGDRVAMLIGVVVRG